MIQYTRIHVSGNMSLRNVCGICKYNGVLSEINHICYHSIKGSVAGLGFVNVTYILYVMLTRQYNTALNFNERLIYLLCKVVSLTTKPYCFIYTMYNLKFKVYFNYTRAGYSFIVALFIFAFMVIVAAVERLRIIQSIILILYVMFKWNILKIVRIQLITSSQ